MTYKHMDEAWRRAIEVSRQWLTDHPSVNRAVLASDLFGRIRIIVWGAPNNGEPFESDLAQVLKEGAGGWWQGDVWVAKDGVADPVHDVAWSEAKPDRELPQRLRLLERHRNRGAWFAPPGDPLWPLGDADEDNCPPVVVFYSFKGGLGRSTALAAFAIQRARMGERVAVLDFDLDAPGVGTLLAADADGRTAQWGTLDLLLEHEAPAPLSDYYHPCRRQDVVGEGELFVFPAGLLNSAYPGKLARVDFEPSRKTGSPSAIERLLLSVRDQLALDWILLDARTGLSEPAGALLSGLAHLHVLFGTPSEQSWLGLRVVIEHLGARRVSQGKSQGDCILVQAMVPADTETARRAKESFEDRARDEFSNTETGYYAEASDDAWDLADLESDDAPHVPAALSYSLQLAHFRDVADVADHLAEGADYKHLAERITARFAEADDE